MTKVFVLMSYGHEHGYIISMWSTLNKAKQALEDGKDWYSLEAWDLDSNQHLDINYIVTNEGPIYGKTNIKNYIYNFNKDKPDSEKKYFMEF